MPSEILEVRQLLAANALSMIKLPDFEAAYPTIRGQGMSVAVIDSGFDLDNLSFGSTVVSGVANRITHQFDFADNDNNAEESPESTFSHGTFVASLVAGANRTAESSTFRGIAPQANIIALKVAKDVYKVVSNVRSLDIPEYAILSAMDWVIANATSQSIVAVNMSIGSGNFNQATFLPEFSSRLRSLEDLGVIFVTATGNNYWDNDNNVATGVNPLPPG